MKTENQWFDELDDSQNSVEEFTTISREGIRLIQQDALTGIKFPKVLIEVKGGIAEATAATCSMTVFIRDRDAEAVEESEVESFTPRIVSPSKLKSLSEE